MKMSSSFLIGRTLQIKEIDMSNEQAKGPMEVTATYDQDSILKGEV